MFIDGFAPSINFRYSRTVSKEKNKRLVMLEWINDANVSNYRINCPNMECDPDNVSTRSGSIDIYIKSYSSITVTLQLVNLCDGNYSVQAIVPSDEPPASFSTSTPFSMPYSSITLNDTNTTPITIQSTSISGILYK